MNEFEVNARNALKLIYEQNGSWAYKQRKTDAFLKAQQEFKQVFGAMGGSSGKSPARVSSLSLSPSCPSSP